MAVTISRPANQSVTILEISTVTRTAPVPLTMRPAAAIANDEPNPIIAPPTAISASPTSTTRFAPKRWPSMPPGKAMTTPGSMNRPISAPSEAKSIARASIRNGPVDATV